MTDRSLSIAEAGATAGSDVSCERTVRLLYQRRSQEMFGFARRLGLGDEEASDAVQETMLRLWRELDSGAEIADPDAWSFRTLYRVGIDSHRLRLRLRGLAERLGGRVVLAADRSHLDGDPARRIEVDAVWQAVDRLPARQRAVLYLRYRADLHTSASAWPFRSPPAPREATRPQDSQPCAGVSTPRKNDEVRRTDRGGAAAPAFR